MPGMNPPPTYPSGPASLFHAAATTKKETIWAYCPTCWTQTDQMFVREDEKREHYICLECQIIHSIAVR